ncbi:MAG: hypothetical protein QOI66_2050 [Myxococcales bacterium]|jgi:predicted outer membrane repeat protein|nr:hypothetical protein [Myxococcales bacterium]
MALLLAAGEARADYNIKATEAANCTFVEDTRCNLAEAIDSVNMGKTTNGSGLHGCVNVGGGKKIVLEGTGAHYTVGVDGVGIAVTGVEITSKVANKDFVEGAVDQRVILVQAGASLTLTGITIQRVGSFSAQVINNQGTLAANNCVVQGGDTPLPGGGVYNTGRLTMSGSKVQNNKTGKNGGGIYTTGSSGILLSGTSVSNNSSAFSGAGLYGSVSPISLVQCTVSGNKSSSNAGGVIIDESTLYMDRTTLQSNTALKNGGAIYNYLGIVTMTGGKVTGTHTAVNGGGLFNSDGDVQLTNATIEGASASADGGGIYTLGPNKAVNLSQSTVQNNKASGNGGGIYNAAANGIYFASSTISNNTATLKGGGIYSSGRCYGISSTISTNTASDVGGGVYSIHDTNSYLELSWTTVGYNHGLHGAGVYVDGHANTYTHSSIVAKNFLPSGTPQDYTGNPHGEDGLDIKWRNVFGTFDGITPWTTDQLKQVDILANSNILPLADNGGPTKTHEIPTTSTALHAFVGGLGSVCPASDQRGLPRPAPVGTACDLGSYERQ